ncbi:MAG: thioredoxin [Ruminococcaceae bacterium]|nr:thioredoxin [Oscillospiraceae bacterium]
MQHMTTAEFESLSAQDKPILIDFFATWCGPCKMLSPVLEAVSTEYPDITFVKVDVDQEPDLARRFGITVIPTVFLLRQGKTLASRTGYMDADQLRAFLDNAL